MTRYQPLEAVYVKDDEFYRVGYEGVTKIALECSHYGEPNGYSRSITVEKGEDCYATFTADNVIAWYLFGFLPKWPAE